MSCHTSCCTVRSLWISAVTALVLSVPGSCFAGLVQYWTFDDGAGTTAVNEVGTNTGTLVPGGSGPDWVTSGLATPLTSRTFMPSTAALNFKPSGPDFVNLGNLGLATTASSGEVTLSMWIHPNALTNDSRLFGQLSGAVAQGGAAHIAGGGSIELWNGGAWIPVLPSGNLTAGTWQHLAFVWTNNSVQAVLDGTAFAPATVPFEFATADFGLGARFLNTHGTGFDGLYDDVSVWDHALSPAEINILASGQPLLAETVPVPEPTSFFLMSVGAVGLLKGRRRRSCQQK